MGTGKDGRISEPSKTLCWWQSLHLLQVRGHHLPFQSLAALEGNLEETLIATADLQKPSSDLGLHAENKGWQQVGS